MNAKELLREYPGTKEYYSVSDGECFLEEENAQAHAAHFRRSYEKIDAKTGNIQTRRDFVAEYLAENFVDGIRKTDTSESTEEAKVATETAETSESTEEAKVATETAETGESTEEAKAATETAETGESTEEAKAATETGKKKATKK